MMDDVPKSCQEHLFIPLLRKPDRFCCGAEDDDSWTSIEIKLGTLTAKVLYEGTWRRFCSHQTINVRVLSCRPASSRSFSSSSSSSETGRVEREEVSSFCFVPPLELRDRDGAARVPGGCLPL